MTIRSLSDFNKILSRICAEVYHATPIVRNELFNKQKVSGAISTARVNLMNAIVDFTPEKGVVFDEDKFPPEKTIFNTLLENTGIYRKDEENDFYVLSSPQTDDLSRLWQVCDIFLRESQEKKRKLGELIKVLKTAPFKLKQGFIDFWLPVFLLIKKQDFSLYNSDGVYIPNINREALDLLQKSPNEFMVKAFAIDGIKIDFFNQYRKFINFNSKNSISKDSFIETIKPFLAFYNRLNKYAQTTQNFDSPTTAKFRDVLALATDPEKTFFEDLPIALGFKNEILANDEEFMAQYQNLIRQSIDELRACYVNLIERIETNVVENLGLQSNLFNEYKIEIEKRYQNIKQHLLSAKQKAFLTRLMLSQPNKTSWYEAICFVILNKPLSSLNDSEEVRLTDNLLFMFNALTKFIDISEIANESEQNEIYTFELVSTDGTLSPKAFVLPENQKEKAAILEDKINKILSGNENIDVCALLRILNKKIQS